MVLAVFTQCVHAQVCGQVMIGIAKVHLKKCLKWCTTNNLASVIVVSTTDADFP